MLYMNSSAAKIWQAPGSCVR